VIVESTLTVQCEFPNSGAYRYAPVVIALTFESTDRKDEIETTFVFDWGGTRVSFPITLRGCDLRHFSEQLQEAHRNLDGTALLTDFGEDFKLSFKVVDRGKGVIAIDGRFNSLTDFDALAKGYDPENLSHAYATFAFFNARINQSYLPGVIGSIEQFLGESGVSVKAVWD
jgi:hypothetical protein